MTDNVSIFDVDAQSGGYFLRITAGLDIACLDSHTAHQPGSVHTTPRGVLVNSLGGVSDDTRVQISARWIKKPLNGAAFEQTSEAFRTASTFEVATPIPIAVFNVAGTDQGLLTPRPGTFTCSVFMRIEEEPLDKDDPLEVHVYYIAPSSFSEDSLGWWYR